MSSTKAKMVRQPRRTRGSRANTLEVSETGSTTSSMYPSKGGYGLENTYQLAPFSKFKVAETKACMEAVLQSTVGERDTYSPADCAVLAQTLAERVKKSVKALGYQRYKLVSTVTTGQDSGQDVRVTSRCTWNTDTDNSAVVQYSNGDIYVVLSLFAVYYD